MQSKNSDVGISFTNDRWNRYCKIVEYLRGKSRQKVLPFTEDTGENIEVQRKEKGEMTWVPRLNYKQRWNGEEYVKLKPILTSDRQANRVYDIEGTSTTLCANGGGWGAKTGLYYIPSANKNGCEIAEEGDSIRLSHIGSKTGRGRVGKQKSLTLVTGGDMCAVQNSSIRRLTPLECERLQSFPDGWTQFGSDGKEISDTQRYKCLGNAVTTSVIEAIIGEIFL